MNYPPYDAPGYSFYHQYLHEHAIMTQYFRRLHSIDSFYGGHGNYVDPHHYSSVQRDSPQCSSSTSSSNYTCSASSSSTSSNSTEYEIEQENDEEIEEDEESECEYELNVDAILAFRAAKEELKKEEAKELCTSESDSVVIVDSDVEDFEFVELGSLQTLESKLSQGIGARNVNEETQTHKKIMDYLYGEKSATIAGLESCMAVTFDRLFDIHQPPVWPVLPLRL